MAKKLTLSAVHKESAKLNEKVTKTITDRSGNEYEIIVNKYFKKTDIPKLIGDYMSITEQLKENSSVDNYTDTVYLFNVLIIKYMTNVPLPQDGVSLISYVYELINIDVLTQIIESLPQDEVEKAHTWINEVLHKMPEITPQILDIMTKNIEVDKLNKEVVQDGNI